VTEEIRMDTPWAGDAMDTLKMKIGLLKKENSESAQKMAAAEKAKAEADERIQVAEKKIKELSKEIHARKILLDENTDKLQRNTVLTKRKEEATIAAREEIKAQTLREIQLKSEVERVLTALPQTQAQLCAASERADQQLSEVKKLEIRAMLTDQTIEEMEGQLYDAHNMSATTNQKAEDMSKKLQIRTKELAKAQDRAEHASQKLETVNEKLRKADIKMASMQFCLEDCSRKESKYKKQVHMVKAKVDNADQRFARDEEALLKLKERMEMIGVRRNAREEEKKKKNLPSVKS